MDNLKEKGGGGGGGGRGGGRGRGRGEGGRGRGMDVTNCCNHAWQNREKDIFSQDAQNGHYAKSKHGKLV